MGVGAAVRISIIACVVQIITDVRRTANMWKHWFDINDAWVSTIDNLHAMIR